MKKPTSAHWPTVPNEHWGLAQEMRREPTHAEHVLWQVLRRDKLKVRFRRQHPIGPYIADFACPEHNLVIEVDGDVHEEAEQVDRDHAKDEYLTKQGWRVLRFRNERVLDKLDFVVNEIEIALATKR